MKGNTIRLAAVLGCAVLVAVLAAVLAAPARAQDPLKVGPDVYKLIFENDKVRVMCVDFKPGDSIGVHSHPDHFVYVLSPSRIRITPVGKEPQEMDTKEGQVLWIDAETHEGKNVGTTEFRGLVVELKGSITKGKAAKSAGMKPTGESQPATGK